MICLSAPVHWWSQWEVMIASHCCSYDEGDGSDILWVTLRSSSLILINVGFDFAGADRIVMSKVSSSFIRSCRDMYCSKLLVLWMFVFFGCFKYCLSWIAFKGNALSVWTVSFLLFSLSCVFPLISLLITLCYSLQENLARFLLLCRDGRHALCSPWWPSQVMFSHFPLLRWSPF